MYTCKNESGNFHSSLFGSDIALKLKGDKYIAFHEEEKMMGIGCQPDIVLSLQSMTLIPE